MPKLLKPKNYFNLTYSVIPDNKIEQVVGNYAETVYNESTQDIDINNVFDCRGSGNTNLPCVTSSEQQTSDNYFEDVFSDLYTHTYGYDDYEDSEWRRWEQIYGKHVIDIYNNEPIKFERDVDSLVVSSAAGVYRSRVSTGGWVTSLGWMTNFDEDTHKIYCIANYNKSGINSNKEESSDVTGNIESYQVDDYYNGSHLAANGQYLLRITVKLLLLDGYMYYYVKPPSEPGAGDFRAEGNMYYTLISSFKLTVNCRIRSTEQVDFEYHLDVSNYKDYSLTVNGNEYTNSNTTYSIEDSETSVSWAEWISNQILSKYKRGKIFINAKMKMSYLVDSNIDINDSIVIKDINNQYIQREVYGIMVPCVFEVKNMEYICSDEGFNVNVVLLEDRLSLLYRNYVVGSNGVHVVDSNNIKMEIFAEIVYSNYLITSNNQRLVTSDNVKIKFKMEEI